MMKKLVYILLGVIFGLALTKGEAISWYRIQEMFHFQSVHMYGIFMTAVPVGALSLILIKRFNIRTIDGDEILAPRKNYHHGVIIGSLIFGFGWALTGACPGPLYALVGSGYTVTLVTLSAALLGTWVYSWMLPRLPD